MKIEELNPKPAGKIRFNLASYKLVSKEAGCYVITTFDNEILYIGLAQNLNSRFVQHLDNSEKTMPTAEGKAIWFYYLNYHSNNLPELERSWLNQYSAKHGRRPILNKADSPIS